jgi:hypothetical protein
MSGHQPGEKTMLLLFSNLSLACVSGSILEIEPATEVDESGQSFGYTIENNNQSKRRLLIDYQS